MCRRLMTAAIAKPSSTAMTRSSTTVAAKVSSRVLRSARVAAMTGRSALRLTMRSAVITSTPPRAAIGMRATIGEANTMTPSSTTAWNTTASRVRPPVRALTAVRAIAPVAGRPPNRPEATLASPWPTSSRSGFVRVTSGTIPSATRADRSDSSAASAATARAGAARPWIVRQSKLGRLGAGREVGSAPIRATSSDINSATTVATMIATSDNGTPRATLSPTRWRATTSAMIASGATAAAQSVPAMVFHADTSEDSPSPFSEPSTRGSCCRKMITPMPAVNPSTTGSGMRSTDRPRAVMPIRITMIPARIASAGTLSTP